MAKPKVDTLVNTHGDYVYIHTNKPQHEVETISKIEGVSNILFLSTESLWIIQVDPRYDTEEVAEEIRTLLGDTVPDVFRRLWDR